MNSVYIEPNNCLDCYRCIRECAVGAINVKNMSASIDDDACVHCGRCVISCPSFVVKMHNDTARVRQIIRQNETVVASLSPEWVAEFPGIQHFRMIEALKLLGFNYVSETLLGAEKVHQERNAILGRSQGVHISSECPSVNALVTKYFQSQTEKLLPVVLPIEAHAQMIRQWYGPQAKVVYITPCVAMKNEVSATDEAFDCAITFSELRQWMYDDGVEFDFIPGNESYNFEPFAARQSVSRPDVSTFRYEGLAKVRRLMKTLGRDKVTEPIYLELTACEGGCLKSPVLSKRMAMIAAEKARENLPHYTLPLANLRREYAPQPDPVPFVDESHIADALASIGKFSSSDELNCNGCGYSNCRKFAKALYLGHAEAEMCLSYSRHLAHKKFSALLGQLPAGVILVDENGRVVEGNRNMAVLLGPEAELVYDANPGMKGADMSRLISFHKMFADVLRSGDDMLERDIQVKDKVLKVSIFTIQPHVLVCGVATNLFMSDVRNEEIAGRTRQVIKENLETVQKIAYLLGENASRTEAILNSILESQIDDHDTQ